MRAFRCYPPIHVVAAGRLLEAIYSPRHLYLIHVDTSSDMLVGYGNFDIVWDHFSRISQRYTIARAPRDMLYFVPMLIGCQLVLAIRSEWHGRSTSSGCSTRC